MFREALAQRQSRPGHAAVTVIATGAGLGYMLAGSSEPSKAGEIERSRSAKVCIMLSSGIKSQC